MKSPTTFIPPSPDREIPRLELGTRGVVLFNLNGEDIQQDHSLADYWRKHRDWAANIPDTSLSKLEKDFKSWFEGLREELRILILENLVTLKFTFTYGSDEHLSSLKIKPTFHEPNSHGLSGLAAQMHERLRDQRRREGLEALSKSYGNRIDHVLAGEDETVDVGSLQLARHLIDSDSAGMSISADVRGKLAPQTEFAALLELIDQPVGEAVPATAKKRRRKEIFPSEDEILKALCAEITILTHEEVNANEAVPTRLQKRVSGFFGVSDSKIKSLVRNGNYHSPDSKGINPDYVEDAEALFFEAIKLVHGAKSFVEEFDDNKDRQRALFLLRALVKQSELNGGLEFLINAGLSKVDLSGDDFRFTETLDNGSTLSVGLLDTVKGSKPLTDSINRFMAIIHNEAEFVKKWLSGDTPTPKT